MYKHLLLLLLILLALAPACSVQAADGGVEFAIRYSNGVYTMAMRPTMTPAQPGLTLAAQVTIKVPHGVGSERFTVSNVQNLVAETRWTARSRVDAPKEERTADYISFELSFPTQNFGAIRWQAGEAINLFRFSNSGACLGPLALLENNDPFMPPNSYGTNPGNEIDILGMREGNRYLGVYDRKQADCRSPDGRERTAVVLGERSVVLNGNQVTLRWHTVNESDVLGFQLYRQTAAGVQRLNDELLVAEQSGATQGASYVLVDRPPDPDAYALYLLEVVDLNGNRERVTLGAIHALPLFVPFVQYFTQASQRRVT